MENKKFLIVSHVAHFQDGKEINGTGAALYNYLKESKKDFVLIKHPLEANKKTNTIIETYINGEKKYVKKIANSNGFLFSKSLLEFFITIRLLLKSNKKYVFIGIDPLNALWGLVGKLIRRVEKVIFYTADYAPKRFDVAIVNWIYHKVDKIVIKKADQVWNVSKRITDLRQSQGLSSEKNILLTNAPKFESNRQLPIDKIDKHSLVLVSNLNNSAILFKPIIEGIQLIKKSFPNIKLFIIGDRSGGEYLEKLISDLDLLENVNLLGKKDNKELLNLISKFSIGLAPYKDTPERSWTVFGDSMKIREYLLCGLPVITTDIPSTADDIKEYEAGYVIKFDKKSFEKTIIDILKDEEKYNILRKNAIRLAKDGDPYKKLDKLLHIK